MRDIEVHNLYERIEECGDPDVHLNKTLESIRDILRDVVAIQTGDAKLVTTIPMQKRSATGTGTKCKAKV